MRYCCAFLAILLGSLTGMTRADSFDYYTNKVLRDAPESANVKELTKLTTAQITDHERTLKDVTSTLIIVKTNDDRFAKILVQSARQKIDDKRTVRMILVDRFVTYKEGTEKTIYASGKNLNLYPNFRLSLDLGQV